MRHLKPLKKERKKYKRIVVDMSEEEHHHIKLEALKRNIPIRTLMMKAVTMFIDRYSK